MSLRLTRASQGGSSSSERKKKLFDIQQLKKDKVRSGFFNVINGLPTVVLFCVCLDRCIGQCVYIYVCVQFSTRNSANGSGCCN